ncbi:MAG: saccharopine dehydrogenase C-terminal domain-containing protein [bacterium]|nr:saccharopine dehydrogenase C-terminal domain-containing protein [bacterium]MDZ4299357.1 saccharopine dehydrogenase C-terminal domain-containing protein [Candidatus Sungbacteria bacterium]
MQYDFAVIGANGIQGRIVSRLLLEEGKTVFLAANDDYNIDRLIEHPNSEFAQIDLRDMPRAKRAIKKSGAPIIINCAVDDFNLAVTKMVLELGKNYLDLGSEEPMWEDQFALDKDFKAKGIIAISGIGSTPGISNVMLRYVKPKFDTIETVHVGFAWDSNIPKFITPFSLDAIAWEFTKPAKNLKDGKWVEEDPYDCKVDYYYKSIGKQRTQYAIHLEPITFYEFLKDKGVKNIARMASYPPHSLAALTTLINLGLLSKTEVKLPSDGSIQPLEFTIEAMRRLPIPEGYTEKENIFLKVFGKKDGKDQVIEMDCVAHTLPGWEDATCNIDTGFPTAVLAEMIAEGKILEHGVFTPEFVVPPEPFFAELGKRKLSIYENGMKIN